MAAAAEHGRKAGHRDVTTDHVKGKRARELKSQALKPADTGKVLGASRATVYRYLSLDGECVSGAIEQKAAALFPGWFRLRPPMVYDRLAILEIRFKTCCSLSR